MFCSLLLDTSQRRPSGAWHLLAVSAIFSGHLAHLSDMGDEEVHGGLDRALSLSQLAVRLGVKPQTIYDLRSEGRGPKGFRIGSQLRFRESVIDDWIRRLEDDDAQRHTQSSR